MSRRGTEMGGTGGLPKLRGIKMFGCFWCYFIHDRGKIKEHE